MDELRRSPRRTARDLHCPFEPAVHAEALDIQSRSVAWACEVGLCGSEAAARRLRGARIGVARGARVPAGRAHVVQIAADWTTLFCLLDDHIERLDGPASVNICLQELSTLLRSGGEPGQDPMKRACADLHRRLRAPPARRIARFGERVDQLFDAFTWEASVRRAGVIPSLGNDLPMREVTVGLHVEFVIGELACGAELGPRGRHHPAVVASARRASNIWRVVQ